jgi:hypothetical protein
MKKQEFRKAFRDLLQQSVDDLPNDAKVFFVRQILVDYEKSVSHNETNKGQSWTDDELRLVLTTPPTKENAMLLAKAFKRGYGSIEQIFRWAAEDQKTIDAKRAGHTFIQQIKRIAREVGWKAT